MERLEKIKQLVLIFLDIIGEGFNELLDLKPGTYRKYKADILATKDIHLIEKNLININSNIQKLTKTRGPLEDNEVYCRNIGSDKLLVPFYFLQEFLSLLILMISQNMEIMSIEEVLSSCLNLCNCPDESELQEPDEISYFFLKRKLITKEEYDSFYEFKRRSFRKEYYSVCRDVINNRKKDASFFEWPIRKVSETIKINDWNDDIVSSRTIDRMKNETGLRRWSSVKDWISICACDRFRKNEEKLKEYEIFQSRILMAYFFENLVNSETLLKIHKQDYLYELLIRESNKLNN